jgi:transposase
LAQFASQPGMLHPVYIPSELEEQDRQVWRLREQHKTRLAQTKQRLKALLLYHGIKPPAGLKHWSQAGLAELRAMALPEPLRWSVDELLLTLDEARKAVMRANRKLQQLARGDRYKERVARLRTVGGVGLIVAMGFLLELCDPARFADRRALARFLGLCPKVGRSGEQSWDEGRPELGQAVLRSLLVEAAWRWQRADPYARQLFSRYLGNTGMKQKAIVALAHKLAVILWRLAVGALPYLPGLQRVPKTVAGMAQAQPKRKKTPAQAVQTAGAGVGAAPETDAGAGPSARGKARNPAPVAPAHAR